MKKKILPSLAALLCCSVPAAVAAPFFHETFNYLGYYVENFNEGVRVGEAPAGLMTMNISPKDKKNVIALKKPFAMPEQVRDYEITFRLRFFRGEGAKKLETLLYLLDDDGKTTRFSVYFQEHSGPAFRGAMKNIFGGGIVSTSSRYEEIAPVPSWNWFNVRITVQDQVLKFYTDRSGEMTFEGGTCLQKDYKLTGLNFATYYPLEIDDIKVSALPDKKVPLAENGLDIPMKNDALAFKFRTNVYPARLVMRINDDAEKQKHYTFSAEAQNYNRNVTEDVAELVDGKLVKTRKIVRKRFMMPDSCLNMSGTRIFTKTNLQYRFEDYQLPAALKMTEKQKKVSETEFHVEIRNGNELWINQNLARVLDTTGKIKSVTIGATPGVTYAAAAPTAAKTADPLAVSVPLPDFTPKGFPVALCKENLGSFALECDGYLQRSAFDNMQDCFLRRVPLAQYNKAVAICSLDGDPEKTTAVTMRLTRFFGNGGRSPDAAAQQTIYLPRTEKDPLPPGVTRIGKNRFKVEFDLDAGKIQDLIFMEDEPFFKSTGKYLDAEVLGGLYSAEDTDNFYMSRADKPGLIPSGVIVHELTLYKSPAALFVKNGNLGNMFYPDEQPHIISEVTGVRDGTCKYTLVVKNAEGAVVETVEKDLKLKAGEKVEIRHDFKEKSVGYYTHTVTLKDGGKDLVTFNGAYACLAPDTRKAGYESPYFIWNFRGAHGTPRDKEIYGEILKRLGVRRAHCVSEEDMKDYGVTLGCFPRLSSRAATPEERAADYDRKIQDLVKKYPNTKLALIFHEGGGRPEPLELIGGKTEITEDVIAADKKKVTTATELAKAWRRNAPDVKLLIGNSGESVNILAQLFRQKFPADLIDRMGEESVGMTQPPERTVAYSYWALAELARIYGYKNLLPDSCYEWKSRIARNAESPHQLAAWTTRDTLICHVWNCNLMPLPGITEMANSYYNTIWGYGVFSRYPLLQPTPTFSAMANMTRILDRAVYQRMIPTGSNTVYALEWKKGDSYIYAFWSARGNVNAEFTFPADGVLRTDLYGRESSIKGNTWKGEISESPFYLTSKAAITGVKAELNRTYPAETFGMAQAKVVAPMDKAEDWTLEDMKEDKRIHIPLNPLYMSAFKPGKFKLSAVKDEEKGDCLEVELLPEGDCAALLREYAFIRLKQPAAIPGKPTTVGLWVKGNSSWGKLYLELEDADGEIWLSAGAGGYGCLSYDWQERLGINFDGWNFLQFPLTAESPVKVKCPGNNQRQWQTQKTGDGKITYPVKVKGVGIALARKTLLLREMVELQNKAIRLKDFSAY